MDRWGDALRDAGFEPNQLTRALPEQALIERFITFTRELGHFPTNTEINFKARHGDFPWGTVFRDRFGLKAQLAAKILDYCKLRAEYDDISALCEPIAAHPIERADTREPEDDPAANTASTAKDGFVYLVLMKVGREKRYKIGNSIDVERRRNQLNIQLPHDLELVHHISTDDAFGIEQYWHRRFLQLSTPAENGLLCRLTMYALSNAESLCEWLNIAAAPTSEQREFVISVIIRKLTVSAI